MRLRKSIQHYAGKYLGVHVSRHMAFGTCLFSAIKDMLPCFSANTIFDVGANVGQSASLYRFHYPNARIHCFEPVRSTYEQLCVFASTKSNLNAYRIALGIEEGEAQMAVGDEWSSGTNALCSLHGSIESDKRETEVVPMTTLDAFCASQDVHHIDFLKIDTEGADLEVLKGAKRLLAEMAIDVFQAEVGMNADNNWHVPFSKVFNHAAQCNYFLFGIFDQVPDSMSRKPWLRRANAVFISQRFGALNSW